MAAINPGNKAPVFNLATTSGSKNDLSQALGDNQLVVLAFFKVGCPVCQFTFPYLERLHRSYPSVPIWGISQDDADATNAFAKSYGVTFPMVLDEALSSTVDYGLTNVPTTFSVGADKNIQQTIVGFDKKALEELNQKMASLAGTQAKPLFTEADEVPDLKPG